MALYIIYTVWEYLGVPQFPYTPPRLTPSVLARDKSHGESGRAILRNAARERGRYHLAGQVYTRLPGYSGRASAHCGAMHTIRDRSPGPRPSMKDRSPGPKSSIMGIPRSGAHGQTLSDVVDVRLKSVCTMTHVRLLAPVQMTSLNVERAVGEHSEPTQCCRDPASVNPGQPGVGPQGYVRGRK